MRAFRPCPLALCCALLGLTLTSGASRADSVWQLDLIGDMYPAGRALPHPTPANPQFYYPMVVGYTELGNKVATTDTPPPAKDLVRHLAIALANQGYLATRQVPSQDGKGMALSPPPTLLLVFHWGVLRADTQDQMLGGDVSSSSAAAPPIVLNRPQMLGLIAGKDFDDTVSVTSEMETEQTLDDMHFDRFFVLISAYDFNSYLESLQAKRAGGKPTPLTLFWVAKLSMHANGMAMNVAMPTLIDNGGAVFGRGTKGPTLVNVPALPEGKVELGTPKVVP